ncbi:uncharacterized protein LOC142978204 [Anticarsia gemmatalis]|uniref:uncharacterized protein LOC142978204 n=1 Tax=Anticarsia gemmatalis TaxID=129554 RepID=UPI003F76D6E5
MMKLVVLSCVLAAASSALIAPLAYTAPFGLWAPHNYRGPLSLAPGQPANIVAADGRPLDTLDVNLDRSAHYTAKALDHVGVHLLKKRSVIAPWAPARIVTPWVGAAPLAYTAHVAAAPLAYTHAPLVHW